MRAPLLGDVVAAARVLRAAAIAERPALLRLLFKDAETAGRYRRLTGRVLPTQGDGSLMNAALVHGIAREPGLDDAADCGCLAMVLVFLAQRHTARPLEAGATLSSLPFAPT